jgi:prepilin-type processing-associated H-X9-DG protein
MTRRPCRKFVWAAALFLLLTSGSGLGTAGELSSEVPANTIFSLKFGGFTALEEPFKQTALHAIWQEPEIQALLAGPLGNVKARIEAGVSNWPLLWPEVRDLLNGPMAVAVFPDGSEEDNEPALILVARPTDGDKFRSALGKLIESGRAGKLERAFEDLAPLPLVRAREAARQAVCRSNLKQIGLALAMYANDYQGQFPPKLQDLFPDYVTDKDLFECPQAPGVEGYVYVTGLSFESGPTGIAAFDRKGNHEDGRNVLFVDGHVEFMSEAHFEQATAKQPNAEVLRKLDEAHPPAEAAPSPPPPEIVPYTIGSVAVTPLTEDADGPAYFFLEDLFVVGLEKPHLELYLAWRDSADRAALSSSKHYQALGAKLQPQMATVTAFLDVQALLQALAGEVAEEDQETLTKLGVDRIEWVGATVTCDPPGFYNRVFLSCPGERTGLLGLLPTEPVAEDILELAPKMSVAVSAVRMDAAEFYDRLRALVGVMSEDGGAGFDEAMADFASEAGFDLRDDLLAPLGDEFLLYVMPTPLSPFGVDAALLARGTDGGRLKATLEAFASVVREELEEGEEASLRALDVGGDTLYSFSFGPYGPPLSPSFAAMENYAVASLYPGTARGLMTALTTGQRTPELSLLASENFKATRAKVTASGPFISYTDVAQYFNLTYVPVTAALMSAPAQELPFDPMLLPQPETISKHLGGSLSILSVDAEGFRIDQYSPTVFHAGFSPETTGVLAAMLLPALARAREEARKAVCMSNLKQIALALAIYANDYDDKYPPTLQALLPNYTMDELLFECPSAPGTRYLYVPGLTIADKPNRMVVFERRVIHRGGRNVLFVDGHVERMSEEAFQQRWAEQKEQHNLPSLQELEALIDRQQQGN